jgi:hypothetical protein
MQNTQSSNRFQVQRFTNPEGGYRWTTVDTQTWGVFDRFWATKAEATSRAKIATRLAAKMESAR